MEGGIWEWRDVWRVRGIAWKAILSEAVVTRDTVPGLRQYGDCLKDSTLLQPQIMTRYCLTGSRTGIFNRGLRPRLRTLRLVQPSRLVKVVFVVVNRQHRVHNQTVVPVVSVVVKTKAQKRR